MGIIFLINYKLCKDCKVSCVCESWCVEDSKVSFEVMELFLFYFGMYNLNIYVFEN